MKTIIAFFLASCSLPVFSQTNSGKINGSFNTNSPSNFFANISEGQLVYVFNPNSYEGVGGSPFFLDTLTYAHIVLNDDRAFDSVLLRLNLYENKVHFKIEIVYVLVTYLIFFRLLFEFLTSFIRFVCLFIIIVCEHVPLIGLKCLSSPYG